LQTRAHTCRFRAGLAALSLLLAVSVPAGQAQKTRRAAEKKIARPPAESSFTVPFPFGEHLEYAAQWNHVVTAATLKLDVAERRDFYGRAAWHFKALARTIDPVRMIYTLDDQFDSYTDAATLDSLQYEAYIREQSKQEDLVVPMAASPHAARGNAHIFLVLPGTQDPLGLMYRLRAHDWQKEPAVEIHVFDGRSSYDVQARRESAGVPVAVAAGNFLATRVALRVLRGGQEVPNLKIWASFSEDAARTPVLIEAEAPFGTVRAELTARGK